jgi:hypothetical protein
MGEEGPGSFEAPAFFFAPVNPRRFIQDSSLSDFICPVLRTEEKRQRKEGTVMSSQHPDDAGKSHAK